jgi:hypothetical protein
MKSSLIRKEDSDYGLRIIEVISPAMSQKTIAGEFILKKVRLFICSFNN